MSHKVISLFTGAGGLDLGVEAAGFDTKVCVELDKLSCATLNTNRSWNVIENDIHKVSTRQILNAGNLKRGSASLLVGGPPCQPFSKSGFWKTGTTLRMDDPRAATLREYLRVLQESLPQTFLLENVPGFAYEEKAEGLAYFLRHLKRINRESKTNYSASWAILNAGDYGVPQRRERLFIIGSKDGRCFKFPEPTHGKAINQKRLLTVWDAIGDLEDDVDPSLYQMGGRWADLLPSIPEGKNYLWHTERGGGRPIFKWRSRYWNFLLKLSKKELAWTIQASPGPATGPFHWKNRRLTEKELSRLQTFPKNYRILGDLPSVQRQLGNAVPSALAEVLALQIRSQLLGDNVKKKITLLPSQKEASPRATRIRPVMPEYLQLINKSRFRGLSLI